MFKIIKIKTFSYKRKINKNISTLANIKYKQLDWHSHVRRMTLERLPEKD